MLWGLSHTTQKKNHTPNLRCFFLQPTTTTANDGHVAINRSKLARAFSCESALRSLLAKKKMVPTENPGRARETEVGEELLHTRTQTQNTAIGHRNAEILRNLRSPHTNAQHTDWLNDQDGEYTRRGRRALCLAGELCCCRCRIWPLRIDEWSWHRDVWQPGNSNASSPWLLSRVNSLLLPFSLSWEHARAISLLFGGDDDKDAFYCGFISKRVCYAWEEKDF